MGEMKNFYKELNRRFEKLNWFQKSLLLFMGIFVISTSLEICIFKIDPPIALLQNFFSSLMFSVIFAFFMRYLKE